MVVRWCLQVDRDGRRWPMEVGLVQVQLAMEANSLTAITMSTRCTMTLIWQLGICKVSLPGTDSRNRWEWSAAPPSLSCLGDRPGKRSEIARRAAVRTF